MRDRLELVGPLKARSLAMLPASCRYLREHGLYLDGDKWDKMLLCVIFLCSSGKQTLTKIFSLFKLKTLKNSQRFFQQ